MTIRLYETVSDEDMRRYENNDRSCVFSQIRFLFASVLSMFV